MTDNEIIKEYPFEEETAHYKKEIRDFFSRYENKSGGEDCIEVCLIRAGYRTVLKAEGEINRQKAEIERLEKELEIRPPASASYVFKLAEMQERGEALVAKWKAEVKAEAIKEFAELVKRNHGALFNTIYSSRFGEIIDNLVKEMVGDAE